MIIFPDIDPIALSLGPLQIRWYGISYVVGILIGWYLLKLRSRTHTLPCTAEQISDLAFYVALGILLGGRLGWVLFYDLGGLLVDPWALFKIHKGGMSFHGGLLGVIIAVYWYARKIGLSIFTLTDLITPVVPVGLFFGRVANFINAELWGKPTTLPWAIIFPNPQAGWIPRHPSQLYEAALEGIVLFIILWIYSSSKRPARSVSALFMLFYGLFRFLIEFVREPDQHIGYLAFNWFTMGQALSAPMIIVGGTLLWHSYRSRPNKL